MSEFKLFYQKDGAIKVSRSLEFLKKTPTSQFLWIDLNDVDEEVESQLEEFLKIYIQEEEEMIEIETSSRFVETRDTLVVNMNFLSDDYAKNPVSFIIKNNILISVRNGELASFTETVKRMFANPENYQAGWNVFLTLMDTRIEFDADMIEANTQEITQLSNTIQEADEDALMKIKNLQEKTMMFRENIIDKQRAASNMLRSNLFPKDLHDNLTILIKDINSLLEHIRFSFDRLDYLQDTFLGFVNIEQNKIIKIFTIVSVLFMPPTLIASIYGMNFVGMPELDTPWGYPASIGAMVISSLGILLWFRKKKFL
ncbi:magnesium/cobalt transporter CorA [Candidatus Symbiothrix dinenymphae]|uniref:magnesium/cobalt transporter CorA n=1 Tax=Candidatus Symbiothrix dinenymphae TaxID=467085 RepID=UPI0006C072C8|nr:magnesium/cobalt transporter CorA [Candidatus Symbiothrix dinenymphae]GAP73113.1 magnesium and cobalt transport protein CorA [Candidatus Symbiothrix dinenymphae]